jgi:hypothetical protein
MAEKKQQSLEELYAQQQAVSQAEYNAKQALAEQSAAQQRQSIADELAKQRQAYTSSRQQVQEQAYLNEKSLANQLLNRGLGASGISDVRRLQNKMASDKALTELSQSNADVVKQGMNAQTQTEQSLQNALRQASLEYEKSNLGANETLYGRQQNERNIQLQLAQQLWEAGASGVSPELLKQYSQIASAAVGDGNLRELIESEQLGNINTSQGDLKFSRQGLLGVFPIYEFSIPNVGNVKFNTEQDATSYIKNLYANRENASKINVILVDSIKGSGNKKNVYFVTPDNQKFRTFNAASNYLTNQNKG